MKGFDWWAIIAALLITCFFVGSRDVGADQDEICAMLPEEDAHFCIDIEDLEDLEDLDSAAGPTYRGAGPKGLPDAPETGVVIKAPGGIGICVQMPWEPPCSDQLGL